MPEFSSKSLEKLETCDKRLQTVFKEVIKIYDITILEGHRGKELQDMYFSQGKSKVKYPNSKHNRKPSLAIDVAPWPVKWQEKYRDRWYFLAGIVFTISRTLGISLRWGGDWDRDLDFYDQTFLDWPHFELTD